MEGTNSKTLPQKIKEKWRGISKTKTDKDGNTWYTIRAIQIISGLIALPLIIATWIFLSWMIAIFILIWYLVGVARLEKNWTKRGYKYAPNT